MQYSFLGFSVKKIMEFDLDVKDLAILRYFDDFRDSGRMNYEVIEGEKYYWVSYQSFAKEMPYLGLEKRSIMARMLKLRDLEILDHYTKKEGGTFSYFKLGKRFYELFDDNNMQNNAHGVFKNDDTVHKLEKEKPCDDEVIYKNDKRLSTENDKGCTSKCSSKTNLLNNSSTIDTNIYKYIEEVKEIIAYLNSKVGTNYKESNKATIMLIKNKLKEGYNIDDFKTVIDKKVKTWKNNKFEQYLNPQTLFGDKFEIYLNQNIIKEEKKNRDYEDYRSHKKLRFNNFIGRDYDYDILEKQLLGWA
ncbi:conserved phage C-terminal domain-containing protein [Clostridium sp. MB05]|uniref:conserved phage C-terminal domain-containing protein n=1 Tax=Clostridium sp. MB05 TaxID=3376682 RepID=UPI0039821901